MRWEKEKRYYYLIHYREGDIGAVVVVPKKDSNDFYPIIKIEKILTPDVYLGHADRIIEGHEISANELQGGAAENHYFDSYEFMRRIFIGDP
jgi:hypothetical protein